MVVYSVAVLLMAAIKRGNMVVYNVSVLLVVRELMASIKGGGLYHSGL
jgi:hypothetical protein